MEEAEEEMITVIECHSHASGLILLAGKGPGPLGWTGNLAGETWTWKFRRSVGLRDRGIDGLEFAGWPWGLLNDLWRLLSG